MQITIRHQLDPEVEAMLQAAYSRTHATIAERVQGMNEEQLKDSLKTYYLGYGHASINQTAFITIYLEGVSILAAKVVQDDQLYNGQESSTRYIPFDEQPLYPAPLPVGNYAEKLMSYYKQVVPIAIEHERIANPGMNERGVRAKAFDYVRCLLPMGVTTQLSWTTSLYSAREGCLRMMASVYPEVVNIAKSLWEKLHKLYPSSFEPIEDVKRLTPQTIDLYRQMANTHAVCCELVEDEDGDYETVATGSIGKPMRVAQWFHQDAHYHWEPALLAALRSRAPRQHIPRRVDMLCTIYGTIPIDLACWRDLQRHRSVYITNPVFTSKGLHKWYRQKLKAIGSEVVNSILEDVDDIIASCSANHLYPEWHYHMPMGAKVHIEYCGGLASSIYIAELRGKNDVHPILREIATSLADYIRCQFDIPVGEDGRPEADRSNSTIFKGDGDGMQG